MAKNYKKGVSGEDKANKRKSGGSMSDLLAAAGMPPSKGIEKSEPKKSKPSKDFANGNKNTVSKNVSNQKFINPYTFVPISDKEPQRFRGRPSQSCRCGSGRNYVLPRTNPAHANWTYHTTDAH